MGTKVNSNYEDLLTFTRASKGHALRPVSYGDELVANGTFDSDLSGWTVVSGSATVTNGEAVVSYDGANGGLNQYVTVEVGKLYEIKASLTATTSSGPRLKIGTTNNGNDIRQLGVVGDIFERVVATTTTISIFAQALTDGSTTIDNISVKEVTFDQPDGTLTLFEHPDNVPRVEWDADRNRLGLLVEEQRINLVYGSTSPPTDGSSKNPSNKILSPTQEVNADLVVENTSTSAHGVRRTNVFPTQGATDYTISVFAKAKERRYLQLRMYANGTSNDVFGFDLQEGTAPAGGSIQDVGNGWYRCSATLSVDNSTGGFNFAAAQMGSDSLTYYYAGDGSSGMYMFGLQVEAGSFPTSYIKNEGLSGGVTRSADVASIPVADFGWNKGAGTVVAEVDTADASNFGILWSANADSFQNRTLAYINNDLIYMYNRKNNGTEVNDPYANAPLDNTPLKHGYAFTDGDFNHTLNGGAVETVASNEMPVGINSFDIGNRLYTSGGHINGHIKSIQYYPRRLTNAQLQDLTS